MTARQRPGRKPPAGQAFAVWFRGSKVVDERGAPLVVFHGSGADTGEELWPNTFFAARADVAAIYAMAPTRQTPGAGPNLVPVYLCLRNPYVFDAAAVDENLSHHVLGRRGKYPQVREALLRRGYDGIVLRNYLDLGGRQDQFVIFHPEQAKSAIGNRGSFDPACPRICESQMAAADEGSPLPRPLTSAFAAWFDGSKVVDRHGVPLRLYHGTKGDVTAFEMRRAGMSDPGVVGQAAYFTPTPQQAGGFAESPNYGGHGAANVMPVYVSLKHPAMVRDGVLPDGRRLTDAHPKGLTPQTARRLNKRLRAAGYDGVIFMLAGEITQVAAFAPEQIKSAIGNRGTFDASDPDIRHSEEAWQPRPHVR